MSMLQQDNSKRMATGIHKLDILKCHEDDRWGSGTH